MLDKIVILLQGAVLGMSVMSVMFIISGAIGVLKVKVTVVLDDATIKIIKSLEGEKTK